MKKIRSPRLGKVFVGFAFCFAILFVFLPYIMLNGAAAENITITVGVDVLDLELNTGSESGNVAFDSVTPTTDGTLLLAKKDITVTTNALWYAVYLSTTSADTTLCPRTASGACSSTSMIQSVGTKGASFTTPYNFYANNPSMADTWGFALTPYNSASTAEHTANFAAANWYYMGADTEYKTFDRPSSKEGTYGYATFAPVPSKGSDQKIYTDTITNRTKYKNGFAEDDGDEIIVCNGSNESTCNSKGPGKFSIYYGARVTNSLMMGEYTNTVIYTAIAALKDVSTGEKESAYMTPIFGGQGDTVTVALNMTGTAAITKEEIHVYFVDHDMYESHFSGTITDALLEQYGARCVIGNDNDIQTGTVTGNTGVSITCAIPSINDPLGTDNSDSGHNTVVARTNTYDIVVRMPSYNLTFTTYKSGVVGFRYAGLFDTDGQGNPYVKYMQDVTHGICELTETWDTTGWSIGNSTQTTTLADPPTISTFGVNDAFFATQNANGTNVKTMATNYDASYTTVANEQDMTNGQLWEKNMVENMQRTLIDSRDGKSYIVRKLADGNCWMVQNLDLDLQDNVQLTAADTDLNSKDTWIPTNTSGKLVASSAVDSSSSRGMYIVTQKGAENGGSWTWAQTGSDKAHAYDLGATYFDINVATGTPTATGTNTNVTYPTISGYGNNKDCGGATAGAPGTEVVAGSHYGSTTACKADTRNAGNYYNWYAVTAGTGTASLSSSSANVQAYELEADGETPKLDENDQPILKYDANGSPIYSVRNGVAQDSICPKGWKLAEYSGKGSYQYLLTYTYNMASNDYGIQRAPLSFVRGGHYSYSNGNLGNRGSNGYYWESKVNNAAGAYDLYFHSAYLHPQYNYTKGNGFSARCVAR